MRYAVSFVVMSGTRRERKQRYSVLGPRALSLELHSYKKGRVEFVDGRERLLVRRVREARMDGLNVVLDSQHSSLEAEE